MADEEIKMISRQIVDLKDSMEALSWSATLGLIIACVALLFVVVLFFWLRSRGNGPGQEQVKDTIREYLAIGIVIVGLCIVGILGVVAMSVGNEAFRREALAGILPLVGAWVGAVIAYYFGKENFQAASDSTAKLLSRDERLAATPVSKVMIPIDQIQGVILVENLDEVKTKKVKEFADNMPFHRSPVFTKKKLPLLVIHKSTLHEYLAKDADHQTHTFEQIRTKAKGLWAKLNAFGTIKPGATAAEVKSVMQNVGPDCSDVFVTEDGSRKSAVVGLVTNVDLLKADFL